MHSSKRSQGKSPPSRKAALPNRVRIIGGEHRGRRIAVADRPGLRPTPDRVRETLFNWLGQRLPGRACLDLFAGSGALGFEAASRGAARVVMVENDRAAFRALETARDSIGLRTVELVYGDAFDYLKGATGAFDVVFLDPPFGQNALAAALERLPRQLAGGARVYVEAPAPLEPGTGWRELKCARAGQVSYQLLEWRSDDQGGLSGNV
jgi:16S rRNA (guanine(966)-N(2))-methyltransferase RsmD